MARTTTRIEQVMAHVRAGIASRTQVPGTRLPSVRAQARSLAVSVSTVVEAYERLAAEGVITPRPGAGFYVAGPVAPLALTQLGPRLDREVDPLWVSRQSLETDPSVLKPGCGWLPASWMYEEGLRRALRAQARAPSCELVDYATPTGDPALRQLLSRRMAAIGIEAAPGQLMLTESGTHAIDLICRFLLKPGDTVLVDDPCYFNFHALLKAHQVQVVGVPYTPQGPDVALFAQALQAHSPRLYITNSGTHNPTGATLSPLVAHRLLKLIDQSGLVTVEDDIYADFESQPAPRLAAFDGLARVIHIGSFSKTVSASIRCGYIAARPDWIDGLIDLKLATTFGGGRLAADIILKTLTDSGYRKHMDALRLRLARARDETATRLQKLGVKPWLKPEAGMFLWCRLPQGTDAAAVARSCLAQGVVMAPGNAFSQSLSAGDFMRFNVSQCADDKVFGVLARALAVRNVSA
ncbi:aminotransferase class I/II-fold pyridoxal phosphate-dependent enzyme [Xylophilus rhododendri]|uniref:Aminotransferase class I/II-fold pyridoxal phosphate-dependent enzyme n=1 Tax=Xylophilus rhododendri TaxID=2697032 RepID=A0A857JDL4_9BURK|nr:PLP-dependent aminotransferase family protein [Xylophilus rhododendri]QHJ01053.1 aminotransferase class I/II-fold pyridoxal phosphate-dependent enzyme [Xylophilus rhododendri]